MKRRAMRRELAVLRAQALEHTQRLEEVLKEHGEGLTGWWWRLTHPSEWWAAHHVASNLWSRVAAMERELGLRRRVRFGL